MAKALTPIVIMAGWLALGWLSITPEVMEIIEELLPVI